MGVGSSRQQQNDAEQVADGILGQDVAAEADGNRRIRRHLLGDGVASDPSGSVDHNGMKLKVNLRNELEDN